RTLQSTARRSPANRANVTLVLPTSTARSTGELCHNGSRGGCALAQVLSAAPALATAWALAFTRRGFRPPGTSLLASQRSTVQGTFRVPSRTDSPTFSRARRKGVP